jgi:hypothetical protein
MPMNSVEPSMSNTISDVLTRISSIQQQIQQLQSGSLLDSQLGISGGSSTSSTGATSTSDFANQLAAAQGTAATGSTSSGGTSSDFGSLASSALGTGATASSLVSGGTGLVGASGSSLSASASTLPASASSMLTSGQQQFAATLSSATGLNPGVVTSWLLAEESGGAAQSRQSAGNNDWLNIGYTDSATYGSNDSVWSDPVSAANATAQWLKGQDSIPGYGTASTGIQAILGSVGQTPAAQIQSIQSSGWSSGGYPSLDSLYSQVTGTGS